MMLDGISHIHLLDAHERLSEGEECYGEYMEELTYSDLIAPTLGGDLIYVKDKETFLPLFTDMGEYTMMYGNASELSPMCFDFDVYLSTAIPLVINPKSHHIEVDLMAFIGKPKTERFEKRITRRTYRADDLKLLADRFKNRDLRDFLKDPSAVWDYEKFFRKLANSILFTPCILNSQDETVDMSGIESQLFITKDRYIELFTGKDKIADEFTHIRVVNLSQVIEAVIRMDWNGIKIDETFVDRKSLVLNFDDFRKRYDLEKYACAEDWAFKVRCSS